MREGFAIIAFTDRGRALADTLQRRLGGSVSVAAEGFSLRAWTAEQFSQRTALIFIGAAGIAVRAIAPLLRGKADDPAVLCLDEGGSFVIPLLSGHLGGANDLARQVAAITGGTAVITTATDLNHAFAVDLWAKRQNMQVLQPERIKRISARILRGEAVGLDCPFPIEGERPELIIRRPDADVRVSYRPDGGAALQLVPRMLILGVGCRRGTVRETLEEEFSRFCEERAILPQAVCAAATIDRKADEAGLLAFCEAHDWTLTCFTAADLRAAEGSFTASGFVESQVGVDNVCERAAVCAGGSLIEKKYAADGVTFALAEKNIHLDWSW